MKKDGTYNDRYESSKNNIPFCLEDFQEVYQAVTEEEGQINVGRPVCQAICELASVFLTEIAARPISLPENIDVSPSFMLENVRSKFPELYPEGKKLYDYYLKKWEPNSERENQLKMMLMKKKKGPFKEVINLVEESDEGMENEEKKQQ